MKGWEYKVVLLRTAHAEVDEELLTMEGEQGWELVNVVPRSGEQRIAYLKRMKETKTPPPPVTNDLG